MRSIPWLFVLAVGCGGGNSTLDGLPDASGTADDMKIWIPSASAAAVYAQALTPLFLAGVADQNNGTCPAITMNGTTETYTGGCTDPDGNMWVGSAVVTGASSTTSGEGPGHIEYDGFGEESPVANCTGKTSNAVWNGTVDQTADASGNISFTLDITQDVDGFDGNNGCAELADTISVAYDGTIAVSGPSNMQVQTFAGSGEVGSKARGKVSASTDSEVVDSNTCSHEALSGTTTISASGHTAVVTYDGATSCDTTSTVTWTYDGADQGELAGVSCNAGGGASGAASMLLVIGAIGMARRRRPARAAR